MVWPAVMVMAVVLGVAACSQLVTSPPEAKAQQPTTQQGRILGTTAKPAQPADDGAEFRSCKIHRCDARRNRRGGAHPGPRNAWWCLRGNGGETSAVRRRRRPRRNPRTSRTCPFVFEELRQLARAYTEAQLKRIEVERAYLPDSPDVQRARANEEAIGRLLSGEDATSEDPATGASGGSCDLDHAHRGRSVSASGAAAGPLEQPAQDSVPRSWLICEAARRADRAAEGGRRERAIRT